jgi:hypothetical protein
MNKILRIFKLRRYSRKLPMQARLIPEILVSKLETMVKMRF